MGLRIIKSRPHPNEHDLRMVEWETLLAREAKRWAEWRLTNSEELTQSLREKIQRTQSRRPGENEHIKELLRVETSIKALQNIKEVHGQKAIDKETIVDLL